MNKELVKMIKQNHKMLLDITRYLSCTNPDENIYDALFEDYNKFSN